MAENKWVSGVIALLQVELFHPTYNCYLGPPCSSFEFPLSVGSALFPQSWFSGMNHRLPETFYSLEPGFLGFDFHSYKRKSNDDIFFFQVEKRWLVLRFTCRIHHQIKTNVAWENQWKKVDIVYFQVMSYGLYNSKSLFFSTIWDNIFGTCSKHLSKPQLNHH